MTTIPDISELTLEERIGQMLCLGWDGPGALLGINDHARECVARIGAGAMIVMGRNVRAPGASEIDAAGVRAMTEALQELAPRVPLLIATDQEGGRVARLGLPPFTPLPSARAIGRTGRPALAEALARVVGTELAAVGIGFDFAPDADVDSNPANPVIGDRAFAADATTTAAFVAAQVRGFAAGGVLACAKHFPGHGDTHQDSHYDLPTVDATLPDLEARELLPFRAAIAAGVPAIMTAHIRFPAVDPTGVPATLSRIWLTDILRGRLGFAGLVVTDCLEMKAVADHWGTPRAAVLAAIAGADLLLVCHTPARQRETRDALLAAVRSGELPEARVSEAAERVLAAKRRAAAAPRPPLAVLGAAEHRHLTAQIEEAAPIHITTLGEAAPQ